MLACSAHVHDQAPRGAKSVVIDCHCVSAIILYNIYSRYRKICVCHILNRQEEEYQFTLYVFEYILIIDYDNQDYGIIN